MDVKVTDAEVKKSFDEQKKQSFPKDADYKKFLQTSGQTQEDILQRVKLDLLSNKIRDKVVKGKDTVSDKAIADFYNKNKARFAQPEKRDLRVVLTKDKADGRQGQGRAGVAATPGRRSPRSTRSTTPPRPPAASCPRRPRARSTRSSTTPSSPPRRTSSSGPIKTQYGYYVFAVTDDHRGQPADARRGQGDDQADAPVPEPAEGAGHLREGLHEALEGQDGVLRGLQDHGLQERPEGHADPDGRRHGPDAAGPADRQQAPAAATPAADGQ